MLIVDEDGELSDLVCAILNDAGYAVASAKDAVTALEMLTAHEPALILIGDRMRVPDGASFIEHYRQLGGSARIIALTGPGVGPQTTHPGADARLVKPFGPEALLEAVAALMDAADGPRREGPTAKDAT